MKILLYFRLFFSEVALSAFFFSCIFQDVPEGCSATPTNTTRRWEKRNSCSDTKWTQTETFFTAEMEFSLFGVSKNIAMNLFLVSWKWANPWWVKLQKKKRFSSGSCYIFYKASCAGLILSKSAAQLSSLLFIWLETLQPEWNSMDSVWFFFLSLHVSGLIYSCNKKLLLLSFFSTEQRKAARSVWSLRGSSAKQQWSERGWK